MFQTACLRTVIICTTKKLVSNPAQGHQRVQEAAAIKRRVTLPIPNSCPAPIVECIGPPKAAFGTAGNVVANASVGSGAPLTVTVAALASGGDWLDEGDAEDARIVKRSEVACMTPCVELMKIRK